MVGTIEKVLGGLVILVVIIALFIWANLNFEEDDFEFTDTPENGGEEMARVEGLSDVAQDVVIGDFPEGLPIESGVVASESYRHIPGDDAGKQSTISYTSALSMEENFESFKSFIADNGYEIINEENEENVKFLYASDASSDLSVLVRFTGGQVLVNISYLDKQI